MNDGEFMAQLLKQELFCVSGKLKHLAQDKKLIAFIKELEVRKIKEVGCR